MRVLFLKNGKHENFISANLPVLLFIVLCCSLVFCYLTAKMYIINIINTMSVYEN